MRAEHRGDMVTSGPSDLFAEAAEAVAGLARVTPLLLAPDLSDRVGAPVWLKLESLQVTGSFKVRGAACRLAALTAEERGRGVVACSSGNHGQAVAYVAQRLGVPATVYVPEWVDPVKLEGIRSRGARAVLAGATFDESEALAIRHATESGAMYVSAYDDPWVIRGQGTLAAEIVEQLGEAPGAVFVPLSGGGLVAGIAAAFRAGAAPEGGVPQVVAVSAAHAAVMLASLEAGHPIAVPEQETLANALAGGIGLENRHSFEMVRDLVDEHVVVTEGEIGAAMTYAMRHLRLVLEGGGAVALAALLAGHASDGALRSGGPLVVVLSGGNVSPSTLISVLSGPEA